MINHLKGFFSSPRQRIKGWELPIAGLLLTAGLAVTVTSLQAAAPNKRAKAVEAPAQTPSVTAEAPQLQEPVVDSTQVASTVNPVTPEPPAPGIDSTVVAPPTQTEAPQPPYPAFDNTTAAAPTDKVTVSHPRERGISSAKMVRKAKLVVPPLQEPAVDNTTVATPKAKPAASQPRHEGIEPSVATMPSVKWSAPAQEARKPALAQSPKSDTSLADGTYLYGQSSQPGQTGKEYLVFKAQQGKVVGAMYMPNSEFTCFYGSLNSKQMNLTVANPYNQTAFSHTVAREQTSKIAAAGGQIDLENAYDSLTYPYSVGLEGYQPLAQVSDKDQQMLNTCLSNYQSVVWNH
ncbi:MAG TPA: hypothetical protein V6D11_24370 [Waterburya sp.]